MSFDTKKLEAVRKQFTIVELYLDINDPSLDSEFALEPDSFGTPKTTNDSRAYTGTDFKVYRYADQNIQGLDHFGGLISVNSNPPKVEPAKSIGIRATAKATISDFVTNDTFELNSSYSLNRVEGSHFLKLFARNHLKNRRARIIRGFDPSNYDESNCIIENYIIDEFSYPDSSGRVTFNFVDELILIESAKAKAPSISKGELTASITAGATTLSYSTSVTDEYGATSSTGYLAIQSEIIGYTVDSSTSMTITRGEFGTTAASHDSGETMQKCIAYESENIIDVIEDLLTNYSNIPSSWIPSTDWAALKAGDLASYNLTRCIYKPIEVKKLINELIQLAGLTVYADVENQEIVIASSPDFANPVIEFDEAEHMQQGSISIKRAPKDQITRQAIYWNKTDATADDNEKNYSKSLLVINTTRETDADQSNVAEAKSIKSDWLTSSTPDNSIATNLVNRNINRYGDVPTEITFDVDQAYVKAVTGGNMWLGSIFNATTNKLTDSRLNPLTKTYQCLSIAERKTSKYRITGQSYVAAAPPTADFYITEDKTDFVLANDSEFSAILGDVREYVVVISSDIEICSSSASTAAFRQGTFPVGATLKLINLGFIMGKGGAGGQGGTAANNPPFVYGDGLDGGDGGDALELTTDCTIDNGFGFIGGGGGGSGGYRGASLVSGAGGDGGQGCDGGAAGVGGTADTGASVGDSGEAGGRDYAGGNAGEFGEDGAANTASSGGSAGLAIDTNSNSVTITAGNNSEQIKGAVI